MDDLKERLISVLCRLYRDNELFTRSDICDEIKKLRKCSKSKWLSYTIEKLQKLAEKGLSDPFGNKIVCTPGSDKTLKNYARHLLCGKQNGLSHASLSRVIAVSLLEETFAKPFVVIQTREKKSHKMYVGLYDVGRNFTSSGITEKSADLDRLVTSYATISTLKEKNKAFRKLIASIRNALAIEYLCPFLEEKIGDLSRHLTPPTEPGIVAGDATLNTVGEENISTLRSEVKSEHPENAASRFEIEALHIFRESDVLNDWCHDCVTHNLPEIGQSVLCVDLEEGRVFTDYEPSGRISPKDENTVVISVYDPDSPEPQNEAEKAGMMKSLEEKALFTLTEALQDRSERQNEKAQQEKQELEETKSRKIGRGR